MPESPERTDSPASSGPVGRGDGIPGRNLSRGSCGRARRADREGAHEHRIPATRASRLSRRYAGQTTRISAENAATLSITTHFRLVPRLRLGTHCLEALPPVLLHARRSLAAARSQAEPAEPGNEGLFEKFVQFIGDGIERNAPLDQRVSFADCHCLVLQGIAVNRYTERCPRFVLSRVAPAN